ncbi:MAG: alpha/beta hydrolase-fold protein [Gemmatimonadaceae bacterium]
MPRYLLLVQLALLSAAPVVAQTSYPDIHPDRTVTFQVKAPGATSVMISLEASTSKKMERDERGLWRLTIGPLTPNVYAYSVWIDGIRMADLGSPAVKPEPMPLSSMFEIPADTPQIFDYVSSVPHGTLRLHDYDSRSLGKVRRMRVYTPPGYDQNPRARYPLLVLLHGGFDTEATWTEYGRAHFILDNLLARRHATPMVVVMVDGFATRAPRADSSADSSGTRTAFEDDLLNDAIPFVESRYRLKPGRDHRAITGLSMGGGQALTIGLTHIDRFAWIGGMSASVAKQDLVLGEVLRAPKEANRRLKLLWLSCGRTDGLMKGNIQMDEALRAADVRHTFLPIDGGHDWTVWRHALEEFLPLVFAERR